MRTEKYTEDLLEKGKQRQRMTDQLAELVADVAQAIADSVPEEKWIEIDGTYFQVRTVHSNLSYETYLWIGTQMNRDPRFIVDGNVYTSTVAVGEAYNLHGDLTISIQNATRDQYLWFANHIPEIVNGFEGAEDAAIQELREAFDRLKQLAA